MQNFKELLKATKENRQFKAQEHKFNLALAFSQYMKKRGQNNADLARELGTSRAYITKIMCGDQNLSIDKITEIASVLGADAHFHLSGVIKFSYTSIGDEAERQKKAFHNGASMLYAALREQLVGLTSRNVYAPLFLPAWYFKPEDFVKSGEAEA